MGIAAESAQESVEAGEKETVIIGDEMIYLSRENKFQVVNQASLERGNVRILAKTIDAFLTPKDAHHQHLERAVASGNVEIFTPKEKATGATAEYLHQKEQLTIRGNPVVIHTVKGESLRARDFVTFEWLSQKAHAGNHVEIVTPEYTLSADHVDAELEKTDPKKMHFKTALAKGNVIVTNKQGRATSQAAAYYRDADVIFLTGDVKIYQGDNVAYGEKAEVNLTTGISRLTGQKHRRTRMLVYPDPQWVTADAP